MTMDDVNNLRQVIPLRFSVAFGFQTADSWLPVLLRITANILCSLQGAEHLDFENPLYDEMQDVDVRDDADGAYDVPEKKQVLFCASVCGCLCRCVCVCRCWCVCPCVGVGVCVPWFVLVCVCRSVCECLRALMCACWRPWYKSWRFHVGVSVCFGISSLSYVSFGAFLRLVIYVFLYLFSVQSR